MFTETELRDALHHAADHPYELTALPLTGRAPRRRRPLLPLASAAAVAATVVGLSVVIYHAGSPAARPGPAVAGHSSPATRPVVRTSTSSTPVPPPPPAKPLALTDLVQVGSPDPVYQIVRLDAPGGAAEVVWPGGNQLQAGIGLVVLPPGSGFDPHTRFTDAQREPIAGTSGWYGKVILDPPDGVANADTTRKYGEPSYALGYETTDGTWVLVRGDFDHANESASTLRAAYDAMGVRLESGATRLPYRVGYLPAGLEVSEVGPSGANPVSDVSWMGSGRHTLDINISSGPQACPGTGPRKLPHSGSGRSAPCGLLTVDGFGFMVTGTGYDTSTLQRVADSLTVADLTQSGTAGWFPLAQALAG